MPLSPSHPLALLFGACMRANLARPERCQVSSGMPPKQTSSSLLHILKCMALVWFLKTHANILSPSLQSLQLSFHSSRMVLHTSLNQMSANHSCGLWCMVQPWLSEYPSYVIHLDPSYNIIITIQIAIIIPVLHISFNLANHRLAHHSDSLIYGCLNTRHMSSSQLHDAPPESSSSSYILI